MHIGLKHKMRYNQTYAQIFHSSILIICHLSSEVPLCKTWFWTRNINIFKL